MSSIGETLRRERLRQNLDLEQISRELRISQRFLEAIEDERFERLPAGVFAKSFVRQYAGLLGLDPEEMAAEVQRAIEPAPAVNATRPDVAPIGDIHVPRVDSWDSVGDGRRFRWTSSLPALALLVVVLLVCSGIYTFWQKARQQPVTAQVAAPPAVETAPPSVPPPVQQPAATQPPAVAEPAPPQPAAVAETAPKQPPPITPPAEQSTPATSADRPAPTVRVQVTAEEAVWVLARADGKYLFSGTLGPNESRTVEAAEKLTLRLGSAGGVSITLNGNPIPTLGPKGQVREVQFTSGGFQIVAAPKPSLPDDNPI